MHSAQNMALAEVKIIVSWRELRKFVPEVKNLLSRFINVPSSYIKKCQEEVATTSLATLIFLN